MEEISLDLNKQHQRYHKMMPMVTNKVSEQDAVKLAHMPQFQHQ